MRTTKKHTVLLVEDEPNIAADVTDMLYSLGHECVHAASQEEAMELFMRDGKCAVCYVLTDLQIPSRPAAAPRPQVGHNLIKEIRDRYPKTNDSGAHFFPLIVMSAHAREDKYIIEAWQKGASDFMLKPFSQNGMPFADQIRAALARSGRERHESCALMTERAAGVKFSGVRSTLPRFELIITARAKGQRYSVQLNRKEILLPNAGFRILVLLAYARLTGDGWVHKYDLGAEEGASWQGMSRLCRELKCVLAEDEEIIENDRRSRYRLADDVEVPRVDWDAVAKHSDNDMKAVAAKALAGLAARAIKAQPRKEL